MILYENSQREMVRKIQDDRGNVHLQRTYTEYYLLNIKRFQTRISCATIKEDQAGFYSFENRTKWLRNNVSRKLDNKKNFLFDFCCDIRLLVPEFELNNMDL